MECGCLRNRIGENNLQKHANLILVEMQYITILKKNNLEWNELLFRFKKKNSNCI